MKIVFANSLSPDCVRPYLQGKNILQNDWDWRLTSKQRRELLQNYLCESRLSDSSLVFVAKSGQQILGILQARFSQWESSFFARPCLFVAFLGGENQKVLSALLASFYRWLDTHQNPLTIFPLDSRDKSVIALLSESGRSKWEEVWSSVRMVKRRQILLPRSEDRGKKFSVVPYKRLYFDSLLAIIRSTPTYTWLDKVGVTFGLEQSYAEKLFMACVDNNWASHNHVLLQDGNPVGINSYQIQSHDTSSKIQYAAERNTFVLSSWQPFAASLLITEAFADLDPHVPVTGKVNLDNPAMLNRLASLGFQVAENTRYYLLNRVQGMRAG